MTSPVTWEIPTPSGSHSLALCPGDVAVVVGANGAGKSALSYWMATHVPPNTPVVRLLAHRKLWMSSSGPETTPSTFESFRSILEREDQAATSRYRDAHPDQRSANTLYRLLNHVNHRNARVAALVESHSNITNVEPSILTTISSMLQAVGLDMGFNVTANSAFEVEKNGSSYPIEQMSDGEKASFLLAAEVLLADEGSAIVLDEPERHLHRSISARLITQLVESRSDCRFAIFTHDLDLADRLGCDSVDTIILRAVSWSGADVAYWDLQELPPATPMPDDARRAVLGGRDQILFVEGTSGSLDTRLYECLFPGWAVRPSGPCREVIQAVNGLRRAEGLHWVKAAGIVDGDARTPAEASAVASERILVLPVNEIESLYYLPDVIRVMAAHQEAQLQMPSDTLYNKAITAAVEGLVAPGVQSNLAAANAEKIIRRELLSKAPVKASLSDAGPTISISVSSSYEHERAKLTAAVADRDWATIVENFSVRDSPALRAISNALEYRSRDTYQRAVLGRLPNDPELLDVIRKKVGQLPLLRS